MTDDVSFVSLVCEDAREFITQAGRQKRTFDFVIIDCYIGNDVPEFVTHTAFLASIKRIVAAKGLVVYNYFNSSDQSHNAQILLDKLSQIYHCVYSKDILRNIFFYCQ
jgi:spermidine synthase